MEYEEFVQWTSSLVDLRRLTPDQADDVQRQRALFDSEREMIEREYTGRVVGFVADGLIAREAIGTLLDEVVGRYGGERQLYFERIPELVEAESQ